MPAAPPLLSVSGTGEASVPLGSYSSPAPRMVAKMLVALEDRLLGSKYHVLQWILAPTKAPDGVIWKSMLPAAAASSFNRLYARLSFPSAVHPIRMLIEELQPWASLGTEPRCARRSTRNAVDRSKQPRISLDFQCFSFISTGFGRTETYFECVYVPLWHGSDGLEVF